MSNSEKNEWLKELGRVKVKRGEKIAELTIHTQSGRVWACEIRHNESIKIFNNADGYPPEGEKQWQEVLDALRYVPEKVSSLIQEIKREHHLNSEAQQPADFCRYGDE